MSNGDVEARVAAAVEAWQAADWPEAARRAQHALAVGAPVPLLHVLMSSLLRTGDAKQAHRIGESLAGTTSSWDVALARRTLGELSGEGLFAEAPRQSRRLAEAWLVHGERLITEGKAELGALALREAPLVSPLTPYLLIYRSLPVPTDSPRARVMAELRRTVAGDQHAAAVEQARRLLALIDACGESVLPDRPLALSALGIALLRSGQIADAVRTGPAALEAAEHLLGPVHPYMIQAVQNLASILRGAGRLSEAEPLARLALRRAQEALDPNSKEQLLALAYDNLGTLLVARAQHMEESGGETGPLLAEGCEHLREALDRWSRLFGTGHAQCRRTLSSLAIAQQRAGEAEAAATSQRQIDQDLDSGEASHTHDDQVLNNAATAAGRAKDWKRAATLYRRSVDLARANGIGRTPALAARLADLAIALGWLDQPMAAFEATQEAAFVDDLLIGQIFSIASTDERAQLLKEVRARDNRMLSLVSSWLSSEVWRLIEADTSGLGENPESTVGANAEVRRFVRSTIAVVAGTVLQRKGLSVEALSVRWEAMMARRHPEMTGALHELRELELEIARRSMAHQDASSVDKQASAMAALTDRARRLEARIVQHIPEMDISLRVRRVSAFDVVARLPPGSVLLEYVRYESSATTRYAQVIVPAGRSDALDFVDLGPAEDIDHDVAAFRVEILDGDARAAVRDPRVKAPAALPSQRSEVVRRLRATLVDGVLASLPAATRLLVAPDGDLCWLPFGALPLNGDGYLQDRLAVSYVGSGRDVLGWDKPRLRGLGDPLVATAPAFGDGAACGVHFGPLPGTLEEGRAVAQLLGVTPVEGDRVDRALLLSCRAPRILHIATHGYYIPQDADARPNSILFSPTVLANPMLRSGIALAGANSHADGAGLLSAAEITGMDLRGTELVVVSACETGLGEVERGEGVSGMRRAFVVAGARRLVVSLWSVPDQVTAHLMRAFHTRLNRGQRVADALSDAQGKVRRSFPQPVHWAGWVLQGEIGALDGTGPSTTRARPTEAVHASPPWTPAEQRGVARQLGEAAAHFNGGRGAHALVQAREVVARVEGIGHEEARPILVSALQIMAVGLLDTQPRESLAACLRALGVLEGIAERGADDQLILLEAVLLKTAGSAHRILGAPDRAVDCQTRAEIILERRLAQRESPSLSSELSSLYMNKANAVEELGQLRAAVGLYDRSLEVWDRLVAQKHPFAEAYSAKVRLFRAETLRSLGDEHIALAEARAAVATLETLGPALQRPDLGNLITWAEQTFGPAVRQPAV